MKFLCKFYLILMTGVLFSLSNVDQAISKNFSEKKIKFKKGQFTLGDSYCAEEMKNSDWCADETLHQVRLESYAIDKYEVTNYEYLECFSEGICNPSDLHETRPEDFNRENQPVVFISWKDAKIFCEWRGGDLPTEAQWERAAQADNPGGAHFKQIYNTGSTSDVGSQSPSSNGLFDMMGNVYEWTRDWYGPYSVNDVLNPKGPSTGKEKVVRGGAWHSASHYLRVADRVARSPEYKYSDVGIRCSYSLK